MKFIKKFFKKNKTLKIFILTLIIWRVFLFFPIFISQFIFPLSRSYLGGGLKWYLTNPYLYGWANFDGEHYLTISRDGYRMYEYFFFPVFPLLIRFIAQIFSNTFVSHLVTSIIISNISFIISLFGFWKLLRLDYDKKFSLFCIFTLLCFPMSFFFTSTYTESIFFAFIIWTFYFARKKRWFFASLLGLFASATRIVGILMLPVVFIEIIMTRKNINYKIVNSLFTLLIPLGLLSFMFYLKRQTGDPLIFLNTINIFGNQRSSHLILLPQVFYRYFFKIIPNLTLSYFQTNFLTFIELASGIILLVLSVISFFKLRLSYSIFLISGYIVPTLTGSFSSLPRYMLVLFPAFILIGKFLEKKSEFAKVLILSISLFTLVLAESIFMRGYFIS